MAILAWKTKNSGNYGVGDAKPIGEMLLDITGVALSDPNLSWVPTPTNSIYHIGYHAATDNVQEGQGYYENTVIGNNNTSYQISYTNLQSEPWWGSQTTAETWATAYYQSGGGLGAGNRPVLFAYSYSVELNRLNGVFVNREGTQQSFVNGEALTPLAYTRDDYGVTYQMTREGGGGAGVQFWGTDHKDDNELVILANYVVTLFGLEAGFREFPLSDGQTVEDLLPTVGFYVNRSGGVVVSILDGSTFGGMNTNSISITIGTDDNGEYSERPFTGNWIADGTISGTSADNYTIDGFVYAIDLVFELKIYSPTMLVADLSGTIDENFAIVSYNVNGVYGI